MTRQNSMMEPLPNRRSGSGSSKRKSQHAPLNTDKDNAPGESSSQNPQPTAPVPNFSTSSTAGHKHPTLLPAPSPVYIDPSSLQIADTQALSPESTTTTLGHGLEVARDKALPAIPSGGNQETGSPESHDAGGIPRSEPVPGEAPAAAGAACTSNSRVTNSDADAERAASPTKPSEPDATGHGLAPDSSTPPPTVVGDNPSLVPTGGATPSHEDAVSKGAFSRSLSEAAEAPMRGVASSESRESVVISKIKEMLKEVGSRNYETPNLSIVRVEKDVNGLSDELSDWEAEDMTPDELLQSLTQSDVVRALSNDAVRDTKRGSKCASVMKSKPIAQFLEELRLSSELEGVQRRLENPELTPSGDSALATADDVYGRDILILDIGLVRHAPTGGNAYLQYSRLKITVNVQMTPGRPRKNSVDVFAEIDQRSFCLRVSDGARISKEKPTLNHILQIIKRKRKTPWARLRPFGAKLFTGTAGGRSRQHGVDAPPQFHHSLDRN